MPDIGGDLVRPKALKGVVHSDALAQSLVDRMFESVFQVRLPAQDKGEAIEIGRRFEKLGYTIYATRSTAKALNDAGVKARKVNKINQESPTVMDLILGHKIDLVIDTPTQGRDKSRDGFLIRRTSIETGVNCLTSLDTAKALATSLENKNDNPLTLVNIAEL